MRTSGHQSRSSYLVPGRHSRRSRPSPDNVPPPAPNKKKSNLIIILGILLPVLAAVIGVAAWAMSTDTFVARPSNGESQTAFETQTGDMQDRRHRMLEEIHERANGVQTRGQGIPLATQMAASSIQTMQTFLPKTTAVPRQVHVITVKGPPLNEQSLTTKDTSSSSTPPHPADFLSQIISASKNSGNNPPHFLVIAPLHDKEDAESEKNVPPSGNRRTNIGGLELGDNLRKEKHTDELRDDDEDRQASEIASIQVERGRRNKTIFSTPRIKPRGPPPPTPSPYPPQQKYNSHPGKPPRNRGYSNGGRISHMNGGRDQRHYRPAVAMSSPPKSYRPPEPEFADKPPRHYQAPPPPPPPPQQHYQGPPLYEQSGPNFNEPEPYHNDDMHYQDNYAMSDGGSGGPPQHDSDRLGNLGIGLGIPKGITLTIGGFKPLIPAFSPFGILKGIVGSLLPKPHLDLNHRIYFGVELGKGVGIGKG